MDLINIEVFESPKLKISIDYIDHGPFAEMVAYTVQIKVENKPWISVWPKSVVPLFKECFGERIQTRDDVEALIVAMFHSTMDYWADHKHERKN